MFLHYFFSIIFSFIHLLKNFPLNQVVLIKKHNLKEHEQEFIKITLLNKIDILFF